MRRGSLHVLTILLISSLNFLLSFFFGRCTEEWRYQKQRQTLSYALLFLISAWKNVERKSERQRVKKNSQQKKRCCKRRSNRQSERRQTRSQTKLSAHPSSSFLSFFLFLWLVPTWKGSKASLFHPPPSACLHPLNLVQIFLLSPLGSNFFLLILLTEPWPRKKVEKEWGGWVQFSSRFFSFFISGNECNLWSFSLLVTYWFLCSPHPIHLSNAKPCITNCSNERMEKVMKNWLWKGKKKVLGNFCWFYNLL